MKNSFVLYHDLKEQIQGLSDSQIGKLLKAILDYETENTLPNFNGGLRIAFNFIKITLDKDREKYKKKCVLNKQNGQLGGRPKKTMEETKKPNGYFKNRTVIKKPDTDTDTDTDTDLLKENIYIKEKSEQVGHPQPKKTFIKPSLEEVQEYCKSRNNKVDAEKFWNFYESKNWFIGKNKMSNWKAAVITWERSDNPKEETNNNYQSNKKESPIEQLNRVLRGE